MKNNYNLIGVFCPRNKILSLIELIKYQLLININSIRVFHIDSKKDYFVVIQTNKKEECLTYIKNAMVLHSKNTCFFSINALNELNKLHYGKTTKECVVNWANYQNCILILTNGQLSIDKITLINNKCSLFFD